MKSQKPAVGEAKEKDLEVGYTNENHDDQNSPPFDRMDGYSDPFENGTRGGFIKRNDYGSRH